MILDINQDPICDRIGVHRDLSAVFRELERVLQQASRKCSSLLRTLRKRRTCGAVIPRKWELSAAIPSTISAVMTSFGAENLPPSKFTQFVSMVVGTRAPVGEKSLDRINFRGFDQIGIKAGSLGRIAVFWSSVARQRHEE